MLIAATDYKTIYDLTDTSLDVKLDKVIPYAQALADDYCGYSLENAIYNSELYDGGDSFIILNNAPVTSVSSVVVDGLASSDYSLYSPNRLVFGNTQHSSVDTRRSFPIGIQNIVVSYIAGYTASTIPGDLKLALIKLTRLIMTDKKSSGSGVVRQTLHGEDRQFSKSNIDYINDDIKSLLNTYRLWF